jgi:acyl carrier protein
MDDVEIRARVRELVAHMCPTNRTEVLSTDRLAEDLGYDSLAVIELSVAIGRHFTLEQGQETPDVKTVADLEDFVVRTAAVPS